MSDIIQLLPDALANQIAAGEVIQRPSSAVKELLENSIDAGSTSIKLIVKDAGKTLIQVIDDGKGMSMTDARMCFERHATSKIREVDDLFHITTMGFRGEAMASIAAIAQVELKTKQEGEDIGNLIEIHGSEIVKQEPVACSKGTSLSIKNLFFNVPARRNFLKSNPVETKHIIDEFQRVALCNPEVKFSLTLNGVETYHLPAGNFKQRVVGILGKNYAERIVPIEQETDVINIKGFIGIPEFAKKSRGEQYFLVNNRFIKDHFLNHAVVSAYEGILPAGHYPLYAINIKVDPSNIDVNVHPTKQEIKFEDDKIIYAFLKAAVKKGLGQANITPSIDFEQEAAVNERFTPNTPSALTWGNETAASIGITNNPVKQDNSYSAPAPSNASPIKDWKELYETTRQAQAEPVEEVLPTFDQQATISSDWDNVEEVQSETQPYQIHQTYILTHIKSGFLLINQELAHMRIKYDQYIRSFEKSTMNTQQLLFPQTIEVSSSDAPLMDSLLDDVKTLGFDIEHDEGNTFTVKGVPADVSDLDNQNILEGILEEYKFFNTNFQLEKRQNLALSLAKFSCIKEGEKLEVIEMKEIVDQLFASENPNFTPSGKTIFITFNSMDLAKKFL